MVMVYWTIVILPYLFVLDIMAYICISTSSSPCRSLDPSFPKHTWFVLGHMPLYLLSYVRCSLFHFVKQLLRHSYLVYDSQAVFGMMERQMKCNDYSIGINIVWLIKYWNRHSIWNGHSLSHMNDHYLRIIKECSFHLILYKMRMTISTTFHSNLHSIQPNTTLRFILS